MQISSIIEKWDSLLYSVYNLCVKANFVIQQVKLHRILNRNKALLSIHKGQRCFILLNGPSINNHDLSLLKDDVVFASNYFFRAHISNVVNVKYYCWLDGKLFTQHDAEKTINDIKKSCPNADLILNYKAYKNLGFQKGLWYCYTKHIPNAFGLKNHMDGMFSNFSTVAFFTVAAAIYMGFKDIYIMGLDFEPGGFKHFTNLGEGTECDRPEDKSTKEDVCGLHWGYVKAQYESYALADFAKKKGVRIINLNPQSCIRAFEFDSYNNVIK